MPPNPLPKGSFDIAGTRYDWAIRHFAGSSSIYEDARGISVEVRLSGITRKELIIDFAFKDYGYGKPRSMGAVENRIRKCAELAMTKGWEPEAKGKPFRADAEWLEDKVGAA